MWVLTTTSTSSGRTPASARRARKSVLRWARDGTCGRSRSLPTPVSISTVRSFDRSTKSGWPCDRRGSPGPSSEALDRRSSSRPGCPGTSRRRSYGTQPFDYPLDFDPAYVRHVRLPFRMCRRTVGGAPGATLLLSILPASSANRVGPGCPGTGTSPPSFVWPLLFCLVLAASLPLGGVSGQSPSQG